VAVFAVRHAGSVLRHGEQGAGLQWHAPLNGVQQEQFGPSFLEEDYLKRMSQLALKGTYTGVCFYREILPVWECGCGGGGGINIIYQQRISSQTVTHDPRAARC
jgi:hypothetical protein